MAPGDSRTGSEWYQHMLEAADWVHNFCRSSYGPMGGAKLVQQGEHSWWLPSAASALRESGASGPTMSPYVRLAHAVQRYGGDQATGALLLCANLVREALRGQAEGERLGQTVQGYAHARRQVKALLGAMARADLEGQCLRAVANPGWAQPLVEGLRGRTGDIPLDQVRLEVGTELALGWHQLMPWRGTPRPAAGPAHLLVIPTPPRKKTAIDANVILRNQELYGANSWFANQNDWVESVLHQLKNLGWTPSLAGTRGTALAGVACSGSLDDWGDALRARGISVWENASKQDILRLEALLPEGHGAWTWRRSGAWLSGPGTAWLFAVPAEGPRREASQDDGERLLRAAGMWLLDSRAIPGGGAWQHGLAQGLARPSDGLPDRIPLAWKRASAAFAALVEALQWNAGLRPGDAWEPEPVLDGYAVVQAAVDAAFEAAITILRVDAMIRKSSSSQVGLRGGTGKVGSPKGMPGDIPPLM